MGVNSIGILLGLYRVELKTGGLLSEPSRLSDTPADASTTFSLVQKLIAMIEESSRPVGF